MANSLSWHNLNTAKTKNMEYCPTSHPDNRPEFWVRELNATTLASCLRYRGAPGFFNDLNLIQFQDPVLECDLATFESDPSFNNLDSTHSNMMDHHNFLLHAYYKLVWTNKSPPICLSQVEQTRTFQLDVACNFRVPCYSELVWLLHRRNYPGDKVDAYNGHFYRILAAYRLVQHDLRVAIVNEQQDAQKLQLVVALVFSKLGELGNPW